MATENTEGTETLISFFRVFRGEISLLFVPSEAAGSLSKHHFAPSKARRILRGESPRRVRVSHPPVSSLASVAEPRER